MAVIWFKGLNPVMQALLAGLFTWSITAAGASAVFLFKEFSRKTSDLMLGFSAGIMISASFWSLLLPSVELSASSASLKWMPAVLGFLLGAGFISAIDRLIPHLHLNFPLSSAEGVKTSLDKTILLSLAITLHNIPEGLAVGVAFGALKYNDPMMTLPVAATLALGIGIQNFPEGMAVALPIRREGFSAKRSFMLGQMSALVEPIAAVAGAAAVFFIKPILPYALSFAAGAMIFVVIEEVIPESHYNGNGDIATAGAIIGFAIMMLLDTALG